LCCKSGPIIATLSIFKSGYVPGEAIKFNAVIDNRSSKSISAGSSEGACIFAKKRGILKKYIKRAVENI
jgi:hypothetical protein